MTEDTAAWIEVCAARLRELVHDEGVQAVDLVAVARDMSTEARFREMEPRAAAEQQLRETE